MLILKSGLFSLCNDPFYFEVKIKENEWKRTSLPKTTKKESFFCLFKLNEKNNESVTQLLCKFVKLITFSKANTIDLDERMQFLLRNCHYLRNNKDLFILFQKRYFVFIFIYFCCINWLIFAFNQSLYVTCSKLFLLKLN